MEEGLLKRYTEIPFLFYILRKQKLTLVNAASWEDRNDAHYVLTYQKKLGRGAVLALCFTTTAETFHHWKVFSGTKSGVCIDINFFKFKAWLQEHPELKFRSVEYHKQNEARKAELKLADLPFTKRNAYRDECEMRLLYESQDPDMLTFEVDFSPALIRRVVLSPWLDEATAAELKAAIRGIADCQNLEVTRTTLVENQEWKRRGDNCLEC